MEIEDLWAWDFTQEPFEGCEIQCPECKEWVSHKEWEETELPCDDWGSHSAMECPYCDEAFDHVWSPLFKVRKGKG